MKPSRIFIIVFPIVSLLLITCGKAIEQTDNTQLLITLKDSAGNRIQGATVRLYKNAADAGISKISDSTGITLFSNLETVQYFWLAEKGCRNNRADKITNGRPLIRGAVLYGYSILSATGALKITNTSGVSYKVSDTLFNIILNDTPYLTYHKVGSYLIHSEKLSTPGIGKDTLMQIRCGDTSFIRLPY
ncbi:MAG: hypothetical protein ABIW38_10080 [Ferruginibacter sp.]